MKFGKYLDKVKARHPEWAGKTIDYASLKKMLKELHAVALPHPAAVPTARAEVASLTVPPAPDGYGSLVAKYDGLEVKETDFFRELETEMEKIEKHTSVKLAEQHEMLDTLKASLEKLTPEELEANVDTVQSLELTARTIGDDFLSLEKYVNLNYRGFYKILKKHDKLLPATPCRQFYMARLHQQRWINGDFSDIFVTLSQIHAILRRDKVAKQVEGATQNFVRTTRKYWVKTEDVSRVKHHILQNLPVFQVRQDLLPGDSQLTNSTYFDNSSLELYHGRLDKRPNAIAIRFRWYGTGSAKTVFVERKTHQDSWTGEVSVKERFTLEEKNVVPFLQGDYTVEMAVADAEAAGQSAESLADLRRLFTEIYQQIDTKQLQPVMRTQYMRTAYQIPFDATVRISLDSNLSMVLENPEAGPSTSSQNRWCRDPASPLPRSEITRFPHAILEVKLSLEENASAPAWVNELLESGLVCEVHKFSKFIHGTAVLIPDLVQAVPYWFDDVSIRESIILSHAAEVTFTRPRASKAHMSTGTGSSTHGRGFRNYSSSNSEHDDEANGGETTLRTEVLSSIQNGVSEVEDDVIIDITDRMHATPQRTQMEELQHPLLASNSTNFLSNKSTRSKRSRDNSGRDRPNRCFSLFASLCGTSKTKKPLERRVPMRVEPKTFFANERTFLSWMHMAVTIGTMSSGLLAYSLDHQTKQGGIAMQMVAVVLLPVSIMFCAYAVWTFYWRAVKIRLREDGPYDDRFGPMVLGCVMAVGLWTIFIMSLLKIVDSKSHVGM
uniref:SPX domain-containing protein n=1 Tax=Pyramimonas obovata TaxID=1411642 RepID=A0A7S0WG32_9CHLO|mmetsp:Transcript_2489/g.5160  ORF Transcript_2489/g.5160 Transcript_2489/m.5160 type:complete len:780 (+) Transcript_2489:90-2429(+)